MLDIIHATQSKPNKTTNDDIAGSEGEVFWLMDGATQLMAPDHGLDAAWHVKRLSEEFTRLAKKPDMPLRDMARVAIDTVGAEFVAKTGLGPDAPQDLRPFATLILCRQQGDQLEYLQLCDSTLAIMSDNGVVRVIPGDSRLDDLNALEAAYQQLAAGHGFDSPEYKAELRQTYDRVQAALNNPDSDEAWYAVSQNGGVVDQAVTGEVTLQPGDSVVLMSDGFTRAVDTLGIYKDWNALGAAILAKGADAIIDEVRAAERADSDGLIHKRSSRHDDATVLIAKPKSR